MKKVSVFMCLLGVLMAGSAAQATWEYIDYPGTWGNMVNNATNTEGYAYTEVKPVSGPWTVSHTFGNAHAAINNDPINIWSAKDVVFNDWNFSRGGRGLDGLLVVKFNLSDAITQVTWDVGLAHDPVGSTSSLENRYSLNGTDWTTVYSHTTGDSDGSVTFNVPATKELYLGIFTSGTWWLSGGVSATFVPEPATLILITLGTVLARRKRG